MTFWISGTSIEQAELVRVKNCDSKNERRHEYPTHSAWLCVAFVLVIIGCRSASENSQVIAGKTVHKVVDYYSLLWAFPIRDGPATVYWAYKDAAGKEVKHGPYRNFYRGGRPQYEAFYLDGKQDGTATSWKPDGEIAEREFWRTGSNIGWSNYDGGHLVYSIESIFEGNRRVATKKFERGVWILSFLCGEKIDLQIDPNTGDLVRISGSTEVACR